MASAEIAGGAIRIHPVLTTKNGRIFEIWETQEEESENPGGPWPTTAPPPPPPPLPTPMEPNCRSSA